jgi:hypothetical protein
MVSQKVQIGYPDPSPESSNVILNPALNQVQGLSISGTPKSLIRC